MSKDIIELQEDLSSSELYSEDLAPVKPEDRTWSMWDLTAIWVGMAVCIPTYLLASYMIGAGMSWKESLIIIFLANLIITVPMVLNGHAGVKYGVPFPVLGRSSFGIHGINIPSLVRAIVACGWFGIQTWIGGLAIYAIACAVSGVDPGSGLSFGKFVGFAVFWCINMFFIWKGTESIKFLEEYSAPILILMGILLIIWGSVQTGSFTKVLDQSVQMESPTAELVLVDNNLTLELNPVKDKDGNIKASEYLLHIDQYMGYWTELLNTSIHIPYNEDKGVPIVKVQLRNKSDDAVSTTIEATLREEEQTTVKNRWWSYLLWLTIMVGFWATMSLSIADITRYAATQKAQIAGQFIGLPGTMMLYSFVGIFVTYAAVINFENVLISEDAPWDPVSLLARFDNPVVVIVSQLFMLIATLSTNIAANVIAPSNAFSNVYPKKISFRTGGIITGVIGIIICPWILMDEISNILIFISGLLGPVLGIMLSDYYLIRKKELSLPDLYKYDGEYAYWYGFNPAAIISLIAGIAIALVGYYIPSLDALYKLSWFSGFLVSFILYYLLMLKHRTHVDLN